MALFFIAVCGCGGGGEMMKGLVNFPPIVELTASKNIIIVGEQIIITASARDPNGDVVRYEWSADPGGTLVRIDDNKYIFTTALSGEYNVRVRVTDGKDNLWTDATTKVWCIGHTKEYGGIKGRLTFDFGQAVERPLTDGDFLSDVLASPVVLSGDNLRDETRRVVYNAKGAATSTCDGEEFKFGELIVGFRMGVTVEEFAATRGYSVIRSGGSGFSLLSIDVSGMDETAAASMTIDACNTLNADADVEFSQLNHVASLNRTPNDPMYYNQWHYDLINLSRAWDITVGSDDVVVAVLDSGIVVGHEDLHGRLASGYDFISDPYNGCDGDGIDPDPEDVADSRCFYGAIPVGSSGHNGYHGTHVAGTIGAASNNSKGVAGVTWNGKIMPVRVAGRYGIDAYDVIQGMLYAVGLPNDSGTVPSRPAKVLNMSFGYPPGSGCPTAYRTAFEQVHSAGAVAFVSSGNSYSFSGINPIAMCDYAVAVGATDRYGVVTAYSNKGVGLGVVAPGGLKLYEKSHGVLSATRNDNTGDDKSYTYGEGTSMAAPHASGVAALMIAANPAITPSEIVTIISQTATDLGDSGTDEYYGAGLINAYSAVREAKKLASNFIESSTPILSASPSDVHFYPADERKTVLLTNTGSGNLTIDSIQISTELYPDWLISEIETPAANYVALRISVNRNGLPAGTYNGRINIRSNGGEKIVTVRMKVEQTDVDPPEGCQYYKAFYVYLLDNYDNLVSYKTFTYPGGDFIYFDVPDGRYYVMAGTDCNGDGEVCSQYADMCGGHKSYHDPLLITVKGGEVVENIDITLKRFWLLRANSVRIPQ